MTQYLINVLVDADQAIKEEKIRNYRRLFTLEDLYGRTENRE